MVGTCIMCGKAIFKFVKGQPVYPMGNYRSMIFTKKEGGQLEAPFCMDCHNSFKESDIPEFAQKLYEYMKNIASIDSKDYKSIKLTGFKCGGPLKSSDLQGGVRIWR